MLSFMGVEVAAEEVGKGKTVPLRLKRQETLGTMAWAWLPELGLGNSQPNKIDLIISVSPEEGVETYTAQRGTALPINGRGRRLSVPVTWNQDGVPHTRRVNEDNIDVVFLNQNGGYTDVQVSLVTRGGRFYVCAQVVAKGKIVRRKSGAYEFVPTAPEFAFPGASFADTWPNLASSLLCLAKKFKISLAKRNEGVEWQPPAVPADTTDSWRSGVIMFFNMVTGIGRIWDCMDEKQYFVHFNAIVDRQEVPVLQPMTGVHFRVGKDEKGEYARSVKVI